MSEQTFNLIINGQKRVHTGGINLSYEELCKLAGKTGTPSAIYYVRGKGDSHREGILSPGKSVALAEGMSFNVMHTGNA